MTLPIISVENLSKAYLVGHQAVRKERYTALRDVVGRQVKAFAKNGWDVLRGRQIVQGDEIEIFYALKDVGFDVTEGQVVGIIGRNGAGKSTLLKILSRITEPTAGRVTLRGRVASLLEVGTGFHPELTGRENVFLNGAILGMTRNEIKRKFDEIVAFAGVERFLDTPVKRFSSGMYVRLAFAVAAFLEPEILVVDEVLAVGDAEFQKKCLGKMQGVAKSGRTVLFVSHNLPQMALLTEQAVYLQNGRVQFFGPTLDAIKRYEQESADVHRDSPLRTATLQSGDKTINVSNFSVHRSGSGATPITGEGCEIVFDAHFEHALLNPGFIVSICTTSGMELLRISTSPISGVDTGRCQGKVHCAVRLHELPLVAGTYILRAGVSIPNVEYIIPLSEIGAFEVEPSDVYKSGFMLDQRFGLLVSGHEWTIQKPASEVPQ